jgi:hypothetical protein
MEDDGVVEFQVLMNALDLTSVFQFGERSGELTCKVPLIYIYIYIYNGTKRNGHLLNNMWKLELTSLE